MKCFGSGGPTSNGRPMDALDQVHTLTFDAFGRPLWHGQVAGLDACFELRKPA